MAKLTNQQRRLASIDLTLTYLSSYFAEWRYTKVLTLQKLISERYSFYDELKSEIKSPGDHSGNATIAQEIHHGLYFDAISQCIQYIEDLFALLKAAKQPDYFIRNIITYKGGEVTAFLKSLKIDDKSIALLFRFPNDLSFGNEQGQASYERGRSLLMHYVRELVTFYKKYEFFYNQYKHGLAVAMRPFGNIFNDQQIESDRKGEMLPYLAVYDNMNLQAGFAKGTANIRHGIMMPGFTDNVRPFIAELSAENNYIRLVQTADYPNFNIELLVKIAKLTHRCISIFIFNYAREIKPEENNRFVFHLPVDLDTKDVMECTYTKE